MGHVYLWMVSSNNTLLWLYNRYAMQDGDNFESKHLFHLDALAGSLHTNGVSCSRRSVNSCSIYQGNVSGLRFKINSYITSLNILGHRLLKCHVLLPET